MPHWGIPYNSFPHSPENLRADEQGGAESRGEAGRARGMGRGGPGGKESIGVFALGSTFPRQRRERARGRLSCLSGAGLAGCMPPAPAVAGEGEPVEGGFPRYEVTK